MTPGQIAYEARGVSFGGVSILKDSVTWEQLPVSKRLEYEQIADAVIKFERRQIAQWMMWRDGGPTKYSRAVINGDYQQWVDALPVVEVKLD